MLFSTSEWTRSLRNDRRPTRRSRLHETQRERRNENAKGAGERGPISISYIGMGDGDIFPNNGAGVQKADECPRGPRFTSRGGFLFR